MLNGNEWQQLHAEFLSDTQTLICRADECLSHLELISDDRDAMECLLTTLHQLAGKADTHGVETVCDFARQLRYLLYFANAAGHLRPMALPALKRCFELMAWQLELIDPHTGSLALDDSEQRGLLDAFACQCGVGKLDNTVAVNPGWSVNTGQCDVLASRHADHSETR
ncbi:Hpt domain-containing protein [Pseudomonas petrae]|uniref:Hpt domain-containing protein n=1 Tax=Pseudomonas petrae TaxID=2912190 RepID=A0ABS9I3J6_9PSED|nr:Hpt domain-containing protein [Pseudomonas petrae]MCF7534971.1 Hpt domain-containing protein [Pseudomonas petrae]MCF7538193.1 Hpt domain-containing protein [Pseudomonas petrae]MCF7542110.1 Hpt domain-containing protein [Pseudomonas petrae]MCF7555555.1 Hpt domain-containing protein [Pseudomonas petrae]